MREPELMDDPSLPASEHLAALDALARINAISRTTPKLADAIARIRRTGIPVGNTGMPVGNTGTPARKTALAARSTAPLHVVDVACGGGDVTVALAAALAGARRGIPAGTVHVTGIDVSARAIERARTLADAGGITNVQFLVHDAVRDGCPACDVATSSLFLHHLGDAEAEAVLRSMAAAAREGLVISDLIRSRTGLLLALLGTHVLCGSRVARVDGPISVRAARTPREYEILLDRAGLETARVQRCWPERVQIEWVRTAGGRPIDGANR